MNKRTAVNPYRKAQNLGTNGHGYDMTKASFFPVTSRLLSISLLIFDTSV